MSLLGDSANQISENDVVKTYKFREDLWSLGCILFDICSVVLNIDDDVHNTVDDVYNTIPSSNMHPQVSPFVPLSLDYNTEEGLTLGQMQNFLFLDGEGKKMFVSQNCKM